MTIAQAALQTGGDGPTPRPLTLKAGPLTVTYQDGSLRYLSVGGHEIVRQIYAAVRDPNWGTVPGQLLDEHVSTRADSFEIHYRSVHRQGPIHFEWRAGIQGLPDGTLVFTMDGEALTTFKRNRIGFCVLHPMSCAGKTCLIEDVAGNPYYSLFPTLIAPHQPFYNLRAITHEIMPGLRAEVRMEGDTFEMEDQRNWTDASYKTYCTPLGQPFPVTIEAGTRISQQIALRLLQTHAVLQTHDVLHLKDSTSTPLTVTITDQTAALPDIGLGAAYHGHPLAGQEIERLKALNLTHLRVDVNLSAPDIDVKLRQAAREAAALGVGLELALFLGDAGDGGLASLRALLDKRQPDVRRWLIFHTHEKSVTAPWVTLARQTLHPWAANVPFGAGTDAFFAELNRGRPPVEVADLVTFSINPTVHALDNDSIVETLSAQAATVHSARAFSGGLPIAVSPITFRMRYNPNATGPEPATPPGELPPQVDPRQMSLLGAGWALGSIKYLAEAGATSLTYFETTGWRGVMETVQGSSLPEKFRSIPGAVFPMYHVLADIGEFRGGEVITSQSSDILKIDAIVLRKAGRTRLLLANFTPDPQPVVIQGLVGTWLSKIMDSSNATFAMSNPENYRVEGGTAIQAAPEGLVLTLPPYAVARLDAALTQVEA